MEIAHKAGCCYLVFFPILMFVSKNTITYSGYVIGSSMYLSLCIFISDSVESLQVPS